MKTRSPLWIGAAAIFALAAFQQTPLGQTILPAAPRELLVVGPKPATFSPEARFRLVFAQVPKASRASSAQRALASLKDHPLDSAALQVLASSHENPAVRPALLDLAEKTSRRDYITQLALLKSNAGQTDDREAIVHLDRILTVTPDAQAVVFPVMAQGLAREQFKGLMVSQKDRPWFPAFASFAADHASPPASVAWMLQEARSSGQRWFAPLAPRLLARLLDGGDYDSALEFAQRGIGLSPDTVAKFGFSPETTDQAAAPLTWRFASDGSSLAEVLSDFGVAVDVEAGVSALPLARYTSFAPGRYVFEYTLTPESADGRPFIAWRLLCQRGAKASVAWTATVPSNQEQASGRVALAIPEDCPVQQWQLVVNAGDSQTVTRFVVKNVALGRG